MKPSGSSSRRQRIPSSRRSTCGGRARGGLRRRAPGQRRVPSCHSPRGAMEGQVRDRPDLGGSQRGRAQYLLARRLVRRAAGALRRGHAVTARRGQSAAARLPRPGASRGLRGCWPAAAHASGAGAEAAVGAPGSRLAGWVVDGAAADSGCTGCGRRSVPPAAESPRGRFKLLSNSAAHLAAESRGVRWWTLLRPLRSLGSTRWTP